MNRDGRSRGRAWLGLIGLGARRTVGRLRGNSPGRTALCVAGVALAIGLLTVVSGVAVGLATSGTVEGEGVNYWIVPGEDHAESVPLAAEGARLGSVHEVSERIASDERVDYASPVAIQPVRVERPDTGERTYVIALGIVPPDADRSVSGIEVGELDPAYTHYAGGSYDGAWSGEAIVTPGVASRLDVDRGDELVLGGTDRRLSVLSVADRDLRAGFGDAPAIVVPLAELQTATGLVEGDRADQILVATNDRGVRTELEGVYPGTEVVSRGGIAGMEATPTNLPLAMALSASAIAAGIGVAFVATMMGLEVTASRREIATLAAVGFTARSRTLVVVAESVTVTALGGIGGVALGAVGIGLLNAGVANSLGVPTIAELTPGIVAYGLGVAVAIGLLAAPYLAYLAWRTDTLAELSR